MQFFKSRELHFNVSANRNKPIYPGHIWNRHFTNITKAKDDLMKQQQFWNTYRRIVAQRRLSI